MAEDRTGKEVAANEEWIQVRIPIAAKGRLRDWGMRKDISISRIVRGLVMEALEARRDEKGDVP